MWIASDVSFKISLLFRRFFCVTAMHQSISLSSFCWHQDGSVLVLLLTIISICCNFHPMKFALNRQRARSSCPVLSKQILSQFQPVPNCCLKTPAVRAAFFSLNVQDSPVPRTDEQDEDFTHLLSKIFEEHSEVIQASLLTDSFFLGSSNGREHSFPFRRSYPNLPKR